MLEIPTVDKCREYAKDQNQKDKETDLKSIIQAMKEGRTRSEIYTKNTEFIKEKMEEKGFSFKIEKPMKGFPFADISWEVK